MLGAPVSGWRWPLIWAAAAAIVVGQLAILPARMGRAGLRHPGDPRCLRRGAVVQGFGPEDRELFRMRKDDIEELSLPDPVDRAATRRASV